jgi:prepilin-type N-terminal cleavage/methylation domain-containing protein
MAHDRDGRPHWRAAASPRGFTLMELMLGLAIVGTLAAVAIPSGLRVLDDYRTRAAAAYLAHRLGHARIEAIKRSTFVGLRFEADADDYAFTMMADGNGNGLRTGDILLGLDSAVSPVERLCWNFPGVQFGILPGVPDADGASSGSDGVRVGTSRIVSMNPNGSATSGTLYVHGQHRAQYAVRILGATGRVRTMKYLEEVGRWIDR